MTPFAKQEKPQMRKNIIGASFKLTTFHRAVYPSLASFKFTTFHGPLTPRLGNRVKPTPLRSHQAIVISIMMDFQAPFS
jgi:hypothetical protein